MPRRTDIHRILVIGSGPIVIGQGAEFDYSGTQAAKALAEEGFEVILVNSNPATIMTDPEFADRTYIEPVTPEYVELVIAREKPDALLPTMGGQTALNVAMKLAESGVLEKYGVELIGADARAIAMAEDRKLFGEAMKRIGLAVPQGGIATTLDEALDIVEITQFPAIIRPAFTLGGTGGGIAYNRAGIRGGRASRARPLPGDARCSSSGASSAGRNSSSRSCAMARTTSSSSARSRTSIRWACTPGIPSPSRRR